jgi:hypothetical protein
VGLREDDDEREILLLVADRLGQAPLDLLFAVVADGAGAVQEEDYGILLIHLVGGRDEYEILGVAVLALVNFADEAGFFLAGVYGANGADGEQRYDTDDAFHEISLIAWSPFSVRAEVPTCLALRRER